jgi:predicted CXXCH cytochrome family protein
MSDPLQLVACPSCHTPHTSLPDEVLHAGDSWLCARCGQRWTAHRLETVVAYAAWAADHGHV